MTTPDHELQPPAADGTDVPRGIAPALWRAYTETHFQVRARREFVLRVGEASAELAALHSAHGVTSSVFVTACSPCSVTLSEAENEQRHEALCREVRRLGVVCYEGSGQHPSNGWPAEPSLLVLGLDRETACALGSRFDQNAIVWAGADAVPQLVGLR